MKIEGTEKELKKLFEKRKSLKLPKIKFKKNMDNMNPILRGNIMGLIFILVILSLMFAGFMIYKDNNNNYITRTECSIVTQFTLAEGLKLQEEHWIGGILYLYYGLIKWLLIAIGIAWIIHGVGFHVIKR